MIAQQTVKARAIDWALGKTNSGSEQVAIAFRLLEGADENKSITWYGYFTEKTADRTFETLDHCGWEGDDLSKLEGLDRNEVYLVIEHEQDEEGEVRARVRWVNSAGGVAMKNKLSAAEATSFAQRMRGTVLARRKAKGQAPAQQNTAQRRPPARPDVPPHSDDDIPF